MKTGYFTKSENQILYEKFRSSRQEKKKLEIALEAILYREELESVTKRAYLEYLKRRRRPAVELAKEVEKNELMWKTSLKKDALWGNVRWNLTRKYPCFSSAFSVLIPKLTEENKVGTDGVYLYYPEQWKNVEEPELSELCLLYFHCVLHCFFGHMLFVKDKNEDLWNLACDIYVEAVLQEDFTELFSLSLPERIRQDVLGESIREQESKKKQMVRELKKKVHPFRAESIYQYLKEETSIQEWKGLFERDVHDFWRRNSYGNWTENKKISSTERVEKRSQKRWDLAEKWSKIRHQTQAEKGQNARKRGSSAGGLCYAISLDKKKKYDYRRFLERFTFPGEEMMLDLESFDYIPYTYSRSHYERLVFLEPLEYAEVHKLKELVIAIDTSGSCRGKVVQRFLEETYEILSRRENFFRRMRVYLVQCDSMIQECVCIESQEQWKDYVEHLKVRGFGGTDFRPVFDLVERLKVKKEIQQLGGLIYFTDGDGIYPRNAPDYETAFVFLNDAFKKGTAPSWAIELNLQIVLDGEE